MSSSPPSAAGVSPRSPWIVRSSAVARDLAQGLGGKARGLLLIEQMGLPVPPWYALTPAAWRFALAESGLAERLRCRARGLSASPAEVAAASAEIRGWLRDLPVPAALEEAVAGAHEDFLPPGTRVAVRSSAAAEDGATSSFAGLHDTVLAVCSLAEVLDAVRRVWASAYGEAALRYRLERGLPCDEAGMSVVVQQMVSARASGVMFTANPVTGNVHEVLISSLFGLGEGLVGEELPADRYVVDKESLEVTAQLAVKREQLLAGNGGLRRAEVPEEQRRASSLSPEQVLALARAGLEIERRLGVPQDVEFAVADDALPVFLQTRPITTLDELGPAAGNRIVWDHANWAENYPGLCLPMTFSVARRLEEVQYGCFAEMMRIPPGVMNEHRSTLNTSLGYVRGRIVTNRNNRYRLLRLIPGLNFKRRAFLALLSVRAEEMDPEVESAAPTGFRHRYFVDLPALLRLFGGFLRDLVKVDREVAELLGAARRFHARCRETDFAATPPHVLVDLYNEAEAQLLSRWKAPMQNVFLLRALYRILRVLCRSWCADATDSLHNELLRGEEGSQSARPVKELLALAGAAYRDPELRRLFRELSPKELAERLPAEARFAAFVATVERYLEMFYFKGIYEMKLEDETIRDRPELLYGMIRGHLLNDDPGSFDLEALARREHEARRLAEQKAFGAFGWWPWKLPQRWVFRWLLRRVRTLDGYREEVKFLRLQLIGTFRELIRGWGSWLARAGILDDPRDVFYLSLYEVIDYVRGNAMSQDLRGLAALRRREIDAYRCAEPPDDRYETFGLVYHKNRYQSRAPAEAVADGDLHGTGCCHGEAVATVRVLASPLETATLAGEILVAERLHAGWLHLLSSAAGVLVERGEILSHAATVARELGIPTIVGIPGLLRTLKSGQRVKMDGAQGTITLLDTGDES